MPQKPHVSEALRQLRGWITLATAVVWIATAVRLVVFGCVHYTDARWTELTAANAGTSLAVVGAPDEAGLSGREGTGRGERIAARSVRTARASEAFADRADAGAEPNRLLGAGDRVLGTLCGIAGAAGLFAVLAVAALSSLGVIVAGGGGVPGVEKTVTACVWALVLSMVSIPWRELSPSALMPGVFCGYGAVTASSDAVTAAGSGGLSLAAEFVGLPLTVLVGSVFVWWWFRAGVERGIIITSLSELDEVMEREIATIRARGVAGRSPRTIGALNRALGDVDAAGVTGLAAGAESLGGIPGVHPSLVRAERGGRSGEPGQGDGFRRPI